ncbi:LPXTG cell wall anchor domain-containing protein [Streptomyces sp. TRM49041]|uniref:LPXTG cell wall anchor domain-containing protein n=1 Tax=Streptomyces sp. TRM49041 TaxID=2603216 RepID=UPI0011ED7FF8|nr:LPXTG cell wall anchor domain-containing protein [Streptomyces sp. TRM49041]
MPTLKSRWAAAALPVAASLVLAGGAPAFATDHTYSVDIHQPLPISASTWEGSTEKKCADIPSTQDGWHFVLPTKGTTFVKLTVEFEQGGEQVITSFGPPSDKHAYVASAPGDKLVSATAEVEGGEVKWFNLSHMCPGTAPSPSTPTDDDTDEPTASPSQSTDTPSEEPTPSASTSTPGEVAPTAAPSASEGSTTGDLAETGSSAPVGALAGVAAALLAGGAFLVMRRRKAGQH